MTRFVPSTRFALIAATALATAATGCGSQSPEGTTTAALDTTAVRASLDSLQSAFSRTTEQELRSYVTRTALLTAPGGAAWDSLRNAVRTSSEAPTVRIRGRETRILSPYWAYKLTTAHVSLPRPERGDTLSADRTSLLLFRRTEDGWKIHRILNSSSPPQTIGPGPAAPDTTVDGTTTAEAQTARRPRRR